jgi:DNA-binding transcriptional ArsR family regulator
MHAPHGVVPVSVKIRLKPNCSGRPTEEAIMSWMIEIALDRVDLANVRLMRSPNAEIQAALHGLRHPYKHRLHSPLAACLPTYRDEKFAFLMDAFELPGWVPDLGAPTMANLSLATPAEQVEAVAAADLAVCESDLAYLRRRSTSRRWMGLTPRRYRLQMTAACGWFWEGTVQPMWNRIESIAAADLAYRSVVSAARGAATVVGELSAYLRIHDNRRIEVSGTPFQVHFESTGAGMVLLPTVLRAPRLSVSVIDGIPIISYGARGAGRLWERIPDANTALPALMGRTRADILARLRVPATTTAVAAEMDLAPATVSEHLAVLAGSGLLSSWRDGRRVVYELTELGEQLLAVGRGGPVTRRRR